MVVIDLCPNQRDTSEIGTPSARAVLANVCRLCGIRQNDWLAGGGSEGDLMRLMGWHDRSMVDRYAADMQDQRAFEAKRRRGDMY